MLNKLAPVDATVKDSLSHLLADEKLNGTRERDMTAPRADYYYFKPGNGYLLVEDATKHSRPIMVKEYPAKEREWPVLHEQFLRLTTSSQLPTSVANSSNLVKDLRARAMALFVDNVPFRNEQPPVPTLKRSNSLRELPVTPTLPESLPYLKASGNSVVITSNIASTSNANATPGTFVGGVPALGTARDRAIIQMSKRVQVLKGNARLAATVSAKKLTDADRRGVVDETPAPGPHRRRSTGMDAAPTLPVKEFLTQAQVVAMLHQLHAPTTMRKPTYDERVTNRQHVDSGFKRKEQDTASGYCENCRIRYTNLSVVSYNSRPVDLTDSSSTSRPRSTGGSLPTPRTLPTSTTCSSACSVLPTRPSATRPKCAAPATAATTRTPSVDGAWTTRRCTRPRRPVLPAALCRAARASRVSWAARSTMAGPRTAATTTRARTGTPGATTRHGTPTTTSSSPMTAEAAEE